MNKVQVEYRMSQPKWVDRPVRSALEVATASSSDNSVKRVHFGAQSENVSPHNGPTSISPRRTLPLNFFEELLEFAADRTGMARLDFARSDTLNSCSGAFPAPSALPKGFCRPAVIWFENGTT